jgi:hypothetical protein
MSVHDVGDAPLVTYRLKDTSVVPAVPIDATVTATLTNLTTGAVTSLSVAHPGLGTYTARPVLSTAASWLVTFTASGAVTDVESIILVATVAGSTSGLAPTAWAPSLTDVAAHIPTRTRAVGVDDTYLGTFTDTTTPTGDQVAILIEHACAWVGAAIGLPVATEAYPAAEVAAALWAAYWVELAYPERDADVAVYDRLRTDADAQTKRAENLNIAAGGGQQILADSPPLVSHSFPDAPRWADLTFL